jgi:hypothetical protein
MAAGRPVSMRDGLVGRKLVPALAPRDFRPGIEI